MGLRKVSGESITPTDSTSEHTHSMSPPGAPASDTLTNPLSFPCKDRKAQKAARGELGQRAAGSAMKPGETGHDMLLKDYKC